MLLTNHPVLRMVLQRTALGLVSLVIVSLVIFIAVSMLPGDFATAILGRSATPDTVAAFREKLGLTLPWHERYVTWFGDALRLEFGDSFSGRAVGTVIGPRLLNTLILASLTTLIAVGSAPAP